MQQPVFPADWSDCPPADATSPAGMEVFACCKRSPLSAGDFRTAYDRGYQPEADTCQRRGLSVCLTAEDAEAIIERFRRSVGVVAKATLAASHGLIKPTPGPVPTHHTLWRAEGVSFETVFQVCP
jgi:hypothetical protein